VTANLIFFAILGLAPVCYVFALGFYETKVAERLVPLYLEYDYGFSTRQDRCKELELVTASLDDLRSALASMQLAIGAAPKKRWWRR